MTRELKKIIKKKSKRKTHSHKRQKLKSVLSKERATGKRKNSKSLIRLSTAALLTAYFSFSFFTEAMFLAYRVQNQNPIGFGTLPVISQIIAVFLLYPSFGR